METINLSSEQLKKLPILTSDGFESIIYLYNDGIKTVALKIFRSNDDKVLNNKLDKVILLNDAPLPYTVLPQKLVTIGNQFKGYCMEFLRDHKHLTDFIQSSRSKKLSYLHQIKDMMIELHNHQIIIGDFNLCNFLVKDGVITLCDADNWQIQDKQHDVFDTHIQNYLKRGFKTDDNLDTYAFNIMSMSFLTRIVKAYLFCHIRNTSFYNDKNIKAMIDNLIFLNEQYHDDYIIDHIKTKKRII